MLLRASTDNCMAAFSRCWPCWLDPDHAKTISPLTLSRYECELKEFVEWLLKNNHIPSAIAQIDVLMVEYKNMAALSKPHLNYLIAMIYVDIIQAAQIDVLVKLTKLHQAMQYTSLHCSSYFLEGVFAITDLHAAQRMEEPTP